MSKHLVEDKKFDASILTFAAIGLVGFLSLICFIVYIIIEGIDTRLFIVGFVGSILNGLGIVGSSHATSKGPAGPAYALISVQTILFTITQAIFF